ncbi:MAG: undecaprenyldiphospho-muramoylpentapeptide beta-N-acetylglucosaminyltransferase [Planctomycetaceae bacterium]
MATSHLVLFAGGGTGGHLTPALAVAERLHARLGTDCRVIFAGTDRRLERDILSTHGYPHISLSAESLATLKRRPWRFVWANWRAYRQAHAMLSRDRPAVVVGLGGYASVPIVWAAQRRAIPTLLLEQNVTPGRATRFLSERASAVCLAFDESETRELRSPRVFITGTPVRAVISALAREGARSDAGASPTILVLGGSQGASALNTAMTSAAQTIARRWPQALVMHQTGPDQCDAVRQTYATSGLAHVVQPFFDDLPAWYSRATIAISRAGGTTLAELACAGCPAILVPYPHAADDHQARNAELFVRCGAAQMVRQAEDCRAMAAELAGVLEQLLSDTTLRAGMQHRMRNLAHPLAAEHVVELLEHLMQGSPR